MPIQLVDINDSPVNIYIIVPSLIFLNTKLVVCILKIKNDCKNQMKRKGVVTKI